VVSGSVLYLLLRRELEHLDRSRQSLADANAQLTDRETRLNLRFEQAPVGIALVRDVEWDFVNPALARAFGYADLAGMRSKPLQDHCEPAVRDMLVERQAPRGRSGGAGPLRNHGAASRRVIVRGRSQFAARGAGRPAGGVCLSR
jgi:PAS domain-containing protein